MFGGMEAMCETRHRSEGYGGLVVEWDGGGGMLRMERGGVMVNLFEGNGAEGGVANVYLRRTGEGGGVFALSGPASGAAHRFGRRGMEACGACGGLETRVRWEFAEGAMAWFWHVEIRNTGDGTEVCDLVLVQDTGLADRWAVRLNEYYVSQYIDHTPLEHPLVGWVVASRQNQPMGGKHPWLLTGSLGRGVSYATDGLQVYGVAHRDGGVPLGLVAGLPGKRLQGEHGIVAVQDEPVVIEPGGVVRRGFFGWYEEDHRGASGVADVGRVDAVLSLAEAAFSGGCVGGDWVRQEAGFFVSAPWLEVMEGDREWVDAWWGCGRRHEEWEDGGLMSFFTGENCHVVMRAKERRVLRPHGHLLRTGGALVPDEAALTSTAWMGGVFHSMVTQGHVSINRFLSTCHGTLGLFRSHGQRVFVEVEGRWHLLGVPTAFEMAPERCRWLYRIAGGLIEVEASAAEDRHALRMGVRVREGEPRRFLVTHHIALNGDDGCVAGPVDWRVDGGVVEVRAAVDSDVGRRFPDGWFEIRVGEESRVEAIGGDGLLYPDGEARGGPWVCMRTGLTAVVEVVICGRLVEERGDLACGLWREVAPDFGFAGGVEAVERLGEIYPWWVHNALVHYLSPRGLEQYSGGGWGTRDVCQGPLEMLLAMGKTGPMRDLLLRVFRQQDADGDWPQWFMFFERERNIRPGDSHGDIVFWPLLALARYLVASGDAGLLDEEVSYYHADVSCAERGTVREHAGRALALIRARVVPGTGLAAYGHGDWNDSLQPVDAAMRERLCSAWTVTLHYQTLRELGEAFGRLGDVVRAREHEVQAAAVLAEFQRVLVIDGVVAGLVDFRPDGVVEPLLHPRDGVTGLRYSVLPMIHGVLAGMFSRAQAEAHLAVIREHLSGPDGVHLFDRPMRYRGGVMELFQRAESASYFGREIGNMYMHAHLRYAEALAFFGDAEGFFRAMERANPVGIRGVVPGAALRQANCYHSSSDPAFADRYEALEQYDRVGRGEVAFEGGWRVYSSGAGIGVRLIRQVFLGVAEEGDRVRIDPVMPVWLDGLVARVPVCGRVVELTYRIGPRGCGVSRVRMGGDECSYERIDHPYRMGPVRVDAAWFQGVPEGATVRMEVELGG